MVTASLNPLKSVITSRPKFYASQRRSFRNWCYICSNVYTSNEEKYEEEHVVPKELFAPYGATEYPAVLWTCKKYHKQKTSDEQFVISRMLAGVHSVTERYKARIDAELNAVSRSHRNDLYASLLDAGKDQSIYSEGGIYVGEATTFVLPNNRALPFLEKIGKGLWVRQDLVKPNWNDYIIKAELKYFATIDISIIKFNEVPDIALSQPLTGEWKDVFSFYGNSEANMGSIWFMLFYNSFLGTVAIAHKDRRDLTIV